MNRLRCCAFLLALSCCIHPVGEGATDGGFRWNGVGDGSITLAEFPSDYAAAYCAGIGGCYPFANYLLAQCSADVASVSYWYAEVSGASGVFQEEGLPLASQLAGVDAGRLAFDPEAAALCLAAPWPPVCRNLTPIPPPVCAGIFTGEAPLGGLCSLDQECDAGACARDGGGCGVCVKSAGIDAGFAPYGPCATDSAEPSGCDPGLYCSWGYGDGGLTGTCLPTVSSGGTCVAALTSSGTMTSGPCPSGQFCVGLATIPDGGWAPGLCTTPGDVGAPCNDLPTPYPFQGPVTGCLDGLSCVNRSCQLPPTSGPPADNGPFCQPGVAGYDFDAGLCVPLGATGSACVPGTGTSGCAAALSCLQGRCEAPQGAPPCN